MMSKKHYLVNGGGLDMSGDAKWFNHGLHGYGSWANFIRCNTFNHAYRQFKRTPYRNRHSQIDVRGDGKPYVIYAYRYDRRITS